MKALCQLKIPATSANLGPGFDCLGMALNLYNELTLYSSKDDVQVLVEGEGAGQVDPYDNLIIIAYREGFQALDREAPPVLMKALNRVPFSRGLGSSSAAIVAGLAACYVMSEGVLTLEQAIDIATRLDGHPDNILPALIGGVVVASMEASSVVYAKLQAPDQIRMIAVIPDYPLATKDARQALPEHYDKKDAVYNLGHMGLLMAALLKKDKVLLKAALHDRLHEPYRLPLMPGMEAVKEAALAAGAIAALVSGAGSTLLVLSEKELKEDTLLAPLQKTGNKGHVENLQATDQGVCMIIDGMEKTLWQ